MANLAHAFDDLRPWVPELLNVPKRPREIRLSEDFVEGVDDEITVVPDIAVPDVITLNPGAVEWLATQVRESVGGSIPVKDVLLQGRDLIADAVLRTRSVHRGVMLREELRWNGHHKLVGAQMAKLAHMHRRQLATNGEKARKLRFRARLRAMELESVLVSYAATEFVDPKVLDSTLSLDVLCHSSQEMTRGVIVKLGLARAHLDEIDGETEPAFLEDDMWPVVQEAWHREMLNARNVATKWAEGVVARGRSPFSV